MGGYHALVNNCQDFCQKLAKDLDCIGVLRGADVAVAGTSALTIGSMLLGAIVIIAKVIAAK